MSGDLDFDELDWQEPSDHCGVCESQVENPVGYDGDIRVFQFFVDRFEMALPDGDLHITMCEECHDHLSELDIDPGLQEGVDVESNWEALKPVLEDIPPEVLYWTNLVRMQDR